MFFSLNKKIITLLVIFFVLCFTSFSYTLYNLYATKLQEEHLYIHYKNKQYNELLYNYNKIKSGTNSSEAQEDQPNFIDKIQQEQYIEQQHYKNLKSNIYLIISCLSVFAILMIFMIIVMKRLIFIPLTCFHEINKTIHNGIYGQRLELPKNRIPDDFNELEQTYNHMLDNIENQINQINHQKEFLQNILNGIPDAIRVLDFEGNIILTNEYYKNNFSYNKSHTSNTSIKCYQSLLNRKTPCSVNTTQCPLKNLISNKNIQFIQQLPWGKRQYLSVNASRIDTTDRPLIIESFRDLSHDISFSHQQKISSLGFLTTTIAHEIKNNLGSMKLILESGLNKKFKVSDYQKYNRLLHRQILECIKIPERLLKIAHASPDKLQKIDCIECIKDICALLDYEATRNGVEIKIEKTKTIPQFYGNETDFKMIILNLSQNAIKAMPSGGILQFKLSSSSQNINLSITDTGKGIPAENLPHIFEPFFSKSDSTKNTGLGLAIVKSLLHNFNGTIKVKSKINIGTSFELKIPYKEKK